MGATDAFLFGVVLIIFAFAIAFGFVFELPKRLAAREFVARMGRLASGDGWGRWTTPPMTLDPRCRSRPMLIGAIISPSSGTG